MSIETFRNRPDIVSDYVLDEKGKNKIKSGFSAYNTLALAFRDEAVYWLRNGSEPGNWYLNFSAGVFWVLETVIEKTLAQGTCDRDEIALLYNQTFAGTGIATITYTGKGIPRLQTIPLSQLERMRDFNSTDKSNAIFITDPRARETLPDALRAFLVSFANCDSTLKEKFIPGYYSPLASEVTSQLGGNISWGDEPFFSPVIDEKIPSQLTVDGIIAKFSSQMRPPEASKSA